MVLITGVSPLDSRSLLSSYPRPVEKKASESLAYIRDDLDSAWVGLGKPASRTWPLKHSSAPKAVYLSKHSRCSTVAARVRVVYAMRFFCTQVDGTASGLLAENRVHNCINNGAWAVPAGRSVSCCIFHKARRVAVEKRYQAGKRAG